MKVRWLCTECDAEGRGTHPARCPACGCDHAWYETAAADDDPRPMRDVFTDLFRRVGKGTPK